MEKHSKFLHDFKVNEYLMLRLENKRTNIYINGRLFTQCKFLLLNIPTNKANELEDVKSIDEAEEKLDSSMERRELDKYYIAPEIEFWGHCSNIQAWYENDYDTRILHRNLAFPLLKALMRAGDPLAKKVFKEEIAMRLESGYPSVILYLIDQGYLKYLSREEINTILENPNFLKNISKYSTNPILLYKKIQQLILEKRKIDYIGEYDAVYKIVLFGDRGVERTILAQRLFTNLHRSESQMTIGVDFEAKSLAIDNRRIKLQIWNFDGEERFKFLLPSYLRGANGALFIYDDSNYNSLAHIDDWLMIIRKELSQEEIFPIIVVGIVSESNKKRQISTEEAIKIAKSRGVHGFIECSVRTGENVEETYEVLTRLMLTNSGLV